MGGIEHHKGVPLSLSVMCWRSGVPIEGRPKGSAERKGKASPLEAGRGKYPSPNPERVTSQSIEAKGQGSTQEAQRTY